VHAGGFIEARGGGAETAAAFAILVGRGFGFHGRRFGSGGAGAGEFADDFAGGIENLHGDVALGRRGGEVVVDGRAGLRILQGGAASAAAARGGADAVARFEEQRGNVGRGFGGLVQRVRLSRIQKERPWVARIRSWCASLISVTGVFGRLSWKVCQWRRYRRKCTCRIRCPA
jgi:hypothetical protein